MTDTKRTSDLIRGNDPKRWLEDGSSSPFGALSRAGAEERPSAAAKQRARAAVLVATAGSAAAAAATKAAAATTATAGTSAPPVSLAASGFAAGGGTGTAATVVTGAAGLSAKFGTGSVLLGVTAKWMGVSAVVATVGFGGYQLASSELSPANPVDSTRGATTAQIETRTLSNAAGIVSATEEHELVTGVGTEPTALQPPAVSAQPPSGLGTAEGNLLIVDPPVAARATTEQPSGSRSARYSGAASELPSSVAVNRELALVDRAWTALRNGKPREALRLIDDYAWTAADRQFESEALLIRLNALRQSGQPGAARALARKVLENHHRGRLADEARRVLAESTPTQ